jgi:hypothetical protein
VRIDRGRKAVPALAASWLGRDDGGAGVVVVLRDRVALSSRRVAFPSDRHRAPSQLRCIVIPAAGGKPASRDREPHQAP